MSRGISRFWLRRLCEGGLFVSLLILVLYAWARFIPTGYRMAMGEAVSDKVAVVAAALSLVTMILCMWLPRKNMDKIAISVYLSLVGLIAILIIDSGGLSSPFIAGWLIVAIFANVFGAYVAIVMAALVAVLAIFTFITGEINPQQVFSTIFLGIAPVALGSVLWHRQPSKNGKTAQHELTEKLNAVSGKSDVVISTIDDGVMAISKDGIIELINPSAQKIIGWNKGDALDLDWRSVLKIVSPDGKEVPEVENPISQSLAQNKPAHSDKYFLVTSSKRRRLVSLISSPVGDKNDGVVVVFRDITKEKSEEREQAEFISTASHEMRTPVASIEGYLGLALNPNTADIDERAREFITKAHKSAQHLGRLFQDLLDISKADDGRLATKPRVINVTNFTKDIFESLKHLAEEKSLNYIFRPNSTTDEDDGERRMQPVFYAHVDPDHLREIISNLISNAIKYTQSGEVVVDVFGDAENVTIKVVDSGIGIPAEDLSHLFQKFYRVDNSETREIGGTGLGLYLARRLAENMFGNLRVESEYKKGSTFYLDVPRISHKEAADKKNQEEMESRNAALKEAISSAYSTEKSSQESARKVEKLKKATEKHQTQNNPSAAEPKSTQAQNQTNFTSDPDSPMRPDIASLSPQKTNHPDSLNSTKNYASHQPSQPHPAPQPAQPQVGQTSQQPTAKPATNSAQNAPAQTPRAAHFYRPQSAMPSTQNAQPAQPATQATKPTQPVQPSHQNPAPAQKIEIHQDKSASSPNQRVSIDHRNKTIAQIEAEIEAAKKQINPQERN